MAAVRTLLALGVAAVSAGCAAVGGFPPLHSTESDLPGGVTETRTLFGLILERIEPDGTVTRAIRPLGSRRVRPDGTRIVDVLPPIGRDWRSDGTRTTQVWPLYYRTSVEEFDPEVGEPSHDRDATLLPVLFWGDESGEGEYFLFLPFGGTLKGKLLSDEITVYGFPFYLTTRKDGWHGHHVLWPLVAWGEGDGRSHFRVLPFWSATDTQKAHHRSVAWPIVHWGTETRGDREFTNWMVFPLVGRSASTDGATSQWTVLYPFFHWGHDTKTGDQHRAILWPIHRRIVRPGHSESTWWWPFWGHYTSATERSTFYLWPLGWDQVEEHLDGERSSRQYFVPFWMHNVRTESDGTLARESFRTWPLFSWEEEPARGTHTLRIPDLVPVVGWEVGETVYTELLTLFHSRSDEQGRAAWDLPLGIVGYRRRSDGSRILRLLWWIDIPLGGGS